MKYKLVKQKYKNSQNELNAINKVEDSDNKKQVDADKKLKQKLEVTQKFTEDLRLRLVQV